MAIVQNEVFSDNPEVANSAESVVEFENDDDKSVASVKSFRVSNEENEFENMAGVFSTMAGDPYDEDSGLKTRGHCKTRLKRFFLSYRVLLIFIPVLLALYIDSTMQLQEAREKIKSLPLNSTNEFNITELHLSAERQRIEERLKHFDPDGFIYLGGTYKVTCLARRNFLIGHYGHSVENATIILMDENPGCVKEEFGQNQNTTNQNNTDRAI
jgi:hypothetical protein